MYTKKMKDILSSFENKQYINLWLINKIPKHNLRKKELKYMLNSYLGMLNINLKKDKIETLNDREIIAVIAYLQRLGKDIKANKAQPTTLTK